MNNEKTIFSNNPKVAHYCQNTNMDGFALHYLETLDVQQVFKAVRDVVHGGGLLLTHPLSGSVKPGESPYKTIVVDAKTGAVDMQSLLLIEDAIDMAMRFQSAANRQKWRSERIRDDFMTIDLALFKSGIASMR